MKINHILGLVTAAALAMLALIAFQVTWMRHSQMLLEEQFNNRVNMALCSTVEKLAENQSCSSELRACCAMKEGVSCQQQDFSRLAQRPEMTAALREALHFYQIDLPYKVKIAPRDTTAACAATPFSCSLQPILADDTHLLQLEFQGKTEYYLRRLGSMIGASVGILTFICLLFGLATFYLLRQKRLSDRNRDFFNHMTHEFRTPLTNIRLASTMAIRKNNALADNPYLHIIRKECDQLNHQVENVLHLAGLEKGDYQLRKAPVNLHAIIREVVDSMALQIRERGGQVNLPAEANATTVNGDAFHIANACRNLLDNALKYGGANPIVSIATSSGPAGTRVVFSDSGAGMAPKEQKKAFRKFYRCESALNSGEKGFGLGLAYVKKIMDLHHGTVRVQSEPGKGTHFELFFPA